MLIKFACVKQQNEKEHLLKNTDVLICADSLECRECLADDCWFRKLLMARLLHDDNSKNIKCLEVPRQKHMLYLSAKSLLSTCKFLINM